MNSDLDRVDAAYRQWAKRSAAGEAHLRRLTARIAAEAGRRRRLGAGAHGPRVFVVGFVAAAAAAAALVAAWIGFGGGGMNPGTGAGGGQAAWAAISYDESEARGRLFREMQRLFPERLRWVAESADAVALGVDGGADAVDERSRPLLVRVVVVARNRGEERWRPVWRRDVLLHADQFVEVNPTAGAPDRVLLWTHVLPDGAIAVETGLRLTEPVRVELSHASAAAAGQATGSSAFEREEVEYRVVQAARSVWM